MEQDFFVTHVAFAYHKKHTPGYVFRQTDRKHHSLVFVLSGELTMTLEKETICVPAGSILMQRQHDSYRLENTGDQDVEYIVISYLAEPEDIIWAFLPQRSFSTAYPQRYQDLFSAATDLHTAYAVCSQTRLRANVQEILCCMIQEAYHQSLSMKEGYAEKAMVFLQNNFSSSLSGVDIAAAAGISVSHLRMVFKKRYGISPLRALNQIRIQRAKALLTSGLFSLREVANACGFENEYYFSRVFKQHTGIPPGKY